MKKGALAPPRGAVKHLLRTSLQFLLRRYPFYVGVMRVVNSGLVKWLTANPEMVTTTLRSGEAIVVDISDYCGRAIYFWGDYDPRVTRLCVNALEPGATMLDIGANFGEVALAAAGRVGPDGAVHAFEPNAKVASCLRQSAELNGFKNMIVHEVALGADDGVGELRGPERSSGAASLLRAPNDGQRVQAVSHGHVTIREAGAYLQRVLQRSISVLKIDVEGMEGPILESMEAILRKDRPHLICFESHNSPIPFHERGPVRCLSKLGYSFEQIVIEATLRLKPKLVRVPPSGPVRNGYDFVAVLN